MLWKKEMARTALHYEKLMPAKKCRKINRRQRPWLQWKINKGLNLGNGQETKKEGVKWKQDTRLEKYSKIFHLPELYYLMRQKCQLLEAAQK